MLCATVPRRVRQEYLFGYMALATQVGDHLRFHLKLAQLGDRR